MANILDAVLNVSVVEMMSQQDVTHVYTELRRKML
jgi:hypothetical protein